MTDTELLQRTLDVAERIISYYDSWTQLTEYDLDIIIDAKIASQEREKKSD